MSHTYNYEETTKLIARIRQAIEKVERTSTPHVAKAAAHGLWAIYSNSDEEADDLATAILNGD